jgi:membrane-associated phospholipid phosphatase
MWIVFGLCLVCAFLVVPAVPRRRGRYRPLFKGTGRHWRRNYYSRRTFLRLGAATLAAGLLAYSGADEAFESWHSGSVRSARTDRVSHVFKYFGERFWFSSWLLVAVVDAWLRTSAFSRWGRHNFEAMVVGLPTLWTVQRVLGANRPSSDDGNPRWRPMAADNSASGHTFIAAVPWLTLARRTRLVPVKAVARFGSVLTGWSRINDRKHYLSQVILGWTIAANAVEAAADQDGAGVISGEANEGEDHDKHE